MNDTLHERTAQKILRVCRELEKHIANVREEINRAARVESDWPAISHEFEQSKQEIEHAKATLALFFLCFSTDKGVSQ
jgi:hypothetical protein